MKKLLVMALVCLGIFSVSLSANAQMYYATVVNCNEWISLREYPSTSAPRITKIPLGATVKVYIAYDDDQACPRNGFYYCEYGGHFGYCLQAYLRL